ncbi:MAG: SusD/RagB family nutrient-binding outer membrane lipoprotein [Labilibaculum sp.]|nr:SusD/RagB family nutrient-binding outer membrane lipoprotein [Labilibaculum sp.]MBI9056484.1 SusD/RagB family nutrient-binding outer membrane lipoprotein [Labilibaculum sp.]
MKYKIIAISLAFLSVFGWGCDNYLDINEDPDVLRDIPEAKVVLPAAELNLANQMMGWDFGFGGGFWSEYWTQAYDASQFKTLCEYEPTSFATAYNDLTAGVLLDCKRMKTVATENNNIGVYYAAEALSIFTWQTITDVWGDVPYFEALKGDEGIVSPKFDEGSVIYADLLARVEALIATDISEASLPGSYDFIYGGDLDQWKLFANSLKLKLMIRLSETSSYNNAALVTFIESAEFIKNNAGISGDTWSDSDEGKRHPMREFEEDGANYLSGNVIASKNFLDYLQENADPRLDVLFEMSGGYHLGAFFGDFASKEDSDENGTLDEDEDYSQAVFSATQDLIIMSTWEINFYIAEVYARAGNNAKGKEYYDLGVQASLSQHGIASSDIATTGYAAWTGGTPEEGIKQIAMQKWVANANYQHIESFLERNRTKYPAVNTIDIRKDRVAADTILRNDFLGELTIAIEGRGKLNAKLPASPIYPTAILTRNENAPAQKQDLLEKVWWNKKAE